MTDQRVVLLARNLIRHSLKLQPGEKVLIETRGIAPQFISALVQETYAAGAFPFVNLKLPEIERELIRGCDETQLKLMYDLQEQRLLNMDCYIGIRMPGNAYEESGVPFHKAQLYSNMYERRLTTEVRCPRTRWVALRYPTPALAQSAGMSTRDFEDFYFKACTLDYDRLSRAMDPLAEIMAHTDQVRITARDTDLRFSIKGIGSVKCDGAVNIPDGQVCSVPVIDSVSGYITYNTPSMMNGFRFEGIRLEFERGKIVRATANDSEKLNAILDTDAGSRYIGEFAIGVNPYVTRFMNDTLFDEKITGSLHFTPGNCIPVTDNGNRSKLHWDLVLIQTPEYGGGNIAFDGQVIRRDGLFVPESLQCLNPDNLM